MAQIWPWGTRQQQQRQQQLYMKVVSIYYLLLFNHFKFMSDYLNFPDNLKDVKEHIQDTVRKTIFSFSRRPEKMVFPKKLRWNMIFLVLLGKMIFLFPENMILHLRRKMKDDLSQKNTRKYDIFLKCSEKMDFSKRTGPGHDLSCTIQKGGIFSRKHGIFSLDGKREKDDLSQEIHGNMIFSI